jgi:hypothetical protein
LSQMALIGKATAECHLSKHPLVTNQRNIVQYVRLLCHYHMKSTVKSN